MTELAQLVALIKLHRLDEIGPISKDSPDIHARAFAQSLADYAAASKRAYEEALQRGGAIDMSIAEEPANAFERCAVLYAPGLIGLLARQFLELTVSDRSLREHLREQATHVRTRIADGDGMGASIWRIALEDVARENCVALGEIVE